jgi:hypothetical protein
MTHSTQVSEDDTEGRRLQAWARSNAGGLGRQSRPTHGVDAIVLVGAPSGLARRSRSARVTAASGEPSS